MKKEKKEFNKAEVEVIEFKKEDDIKTDFSSIPGTGANAGNTPGPNPPFPMP